MAAYKFYDGTQWVELLKSSDISSWAKQSTKPTYTASEVGALPISGGTLTGSLLANSTSVDLGSSSNWFGRVYSGTLKLVNGGNDEMDITAGQGGDGLFYLKDLDGTGHTTYVILPYTGSASADSNETVAYQSWVTSNFSNNQGTVTSVSAGTGLSISGTATVNPTVNIASGYKLPTTSEWNAIPAAANDGTLTLQVEGTTKTTFSANQSGSAIFNVTASDLGLSAALKFIGATTTTITDGSTTNPITINGNSVTAVMGNVVLYGNNEYLWTGSAWEQLGDESSFAYKSITISAGTGLTGGGTLEANRTISLASNYGETLNPYSAKNAGLVLAGPASGSAAAPSFRALVASDIPDMGATYLKLDGSNIMNYSGLNIYKPSDNTKYVNYSYNGVNFYSTDISVLSCGINFPTVVGGGHTFALRGDLNAYLPLSGGTLSGVLKTDNEIWIRGGSDAGGDVNRLTTSAGMPGDMQYTSGRRGTKIYSNGIAFADPYNGAYANDAGWIRHIETTVNTSLLEIATGDDGDGSEEIRFRWYNTSNNIANDLLVPKKTGTIAVQGDNISVFNNDAGYINGNGSCAYATRSWYSDFITSHDTRNSAPTPEEEQKGLRATFQMDSSDGLADGGTYHGVLHFRSYGDNGDLSGGYPIQIAYTANGNLWTRMGTSSTTWGSWNRLAYASEIPSVSGVYLPLTGGTVNGALNIASNSGQLTLINDSSNNSFDSLAYFRSYTDNDWGLLIDKGSYNYGLRVVCGNNATYAVYTNGTIRIDNGSLISAGDISEGGTNLSDKYQAKGDYLINYGSNPQSNDGNTIIQPTGSNPVSMRSGSTSGRDVGIFRISDDNAYLCNSSDNGYTFAIFDTDHTLDFSSANNACFVVLSDHAGVNMIGNLSVGGNISENGTLLSNKYYSVSNPKRYIEGSPSGPREFGNGTLITTSIDYSVTNGSAFYLEIKADGYGAGSYFTIVQGYIYDDTIINYTVNQLGNANIDHIYAMNVGGKLCFWFSRQAYWQSFSATCNISSSSDYYTNYVVSITDSAKPNGTKEVELTASGHNYTNINSYNIGSYITSVVPNWALQPNKPSYDFGEIQPGTAVLDNGGGVVFRSEATSWYSGIYYSTPSEEAVIFANKSQGNQDNAYQQQWLFAYTDMRDRTAWTSLGSSVAMQIKGHRVAINQMYGSNIQIPYNLDVYGTANATTLYENGTSLSDKYLSRAGNASKPTMSNTVLTSAIWSTYPGTWTDDYDASPGYEYGQLLRFRSQYFPNQAIQMTDIYVQDNANAVFIRSDWNAQNHTETDQWVWKRIALYGDNVSAFTNDAGYITSASIPSSLPANGGTANYLNYTSRESDGSGVAQFAQYDGTTNNPSNDWYSHIIMNHANNAGYFTEIATAFHNDSVYYRRKANGTTYDWKRFAFSGESQPANGGNSDTVDSQHANRFGWIYNSSNIGDSSGVTVNDMVTNGNSNATFAMIYPSTDNPNGADSWIHVWSQQWTANTDAWVSQIAVGVGAGTGMWYRTNAGSSIVGKAWTRIIDSNTIGSQSVNYANSAGSVAWSNVSGKPSFAAVATSGSYNDLSNKPTIPATNVIPAMPDGDHVLLSTAAAGTAYWSNWSTQGFLMTDNQGIVSPSDKIQIDSFGELYLSSLNIGAPGVIGTSYIRNELPSGQLPKNQTFYLPYMASGDGGVLATQYWVGQQGYTSNVGTVTSVNNVSPDANGNVSLTIPTQPTLYLHNINITDRSFNRLTISLYSHSSTAISTIASLMSALYGLNHNVNSFIHCSFYNDQTGLTYMFYEHSYVSHTKFEFTIGGWGIETDGRDWYLASNQQCSMATPTFDDTVMEA